MLASGIYTATFTYTYIYFYILVFKGEGIAPPPLFFGGDARKLFVHATRDAAGGFAIRVLHGSSGRFFGRVPLDPDVLFRARLEQCWQSDRILLRTHDMSRKAYFTSTNVGQCVKVRYTTYGC